VTVSVDAREHADDPERGADHDRDIEHDRVAEHRDVDHDHAADRDRGADRAVSAVLSLGSNLGDREAVILDAVRAIAQLPGVELVASSGLVETPALKPAGIDLEAPAYLNAVVTLRTTLAPRELLAAVNAIEHDHGRVREERWGDRTLDIDIVTMDGLVAADAHLTLPHPRAWERAFVLAPWREIEPEAELPGHGRIDVLLAATGEDVRRYRAEEDRAEEGRRMESREAEPNRADPNRADPNRTDLTRTDPHRAEGAS
jgi:2-amino-4-hydroxy-6-hydroxymethyldihydropteridine diphosphokinase